MDVLTIRERAKRLRALDEPTSESQKLEVTAGKEVLTAAERQIRHLDELKRKNGILDAVPPPHPEGEKESLHPVKRRSRKQQIKQKNIQLRLDQIKGLREYSYRSGNLNGNQLNESQICRVALDLFFWSKVNPGQIESEVQLLDAAKEKMIRISSAKQK